MLRVEDPFLERLLFLMMWPKYVLLCFLFSVSHVCISSIHSQAFLSNISSVTKKFPPFRKTDEIVLLLSFEKLSHLVQDGCNLRNPTII